MPRRTIFYIVLAALAYVALPVDLIPEGILPGIGFADDLLVLILLGWFLFTYLPRRRREEAAARAAAGAGRAAGRSSDPAEDPAFAARFASADPYTVLGVPATADRDEIRHAYRELLQQYHPDKVAHLSPEFRDLAHRRAVAIQQAYGRLGGA